MPQMGAETVHKPKKNTRNLSGREGGLKPHRKFPWLGTSRLHQQNRHTVLIRPYVQSRVMPAFEPNLIRYVTGHA